MAPHKRGPWSPSEDGYLLRLVHTQGAHSWVRISHLLGSRSPKQCRERYHQNLKPNLNHDPISPDEGLVIERLVGEMGKRWAEIARQLKGRSDNAVKNWWNGGMNRRRRLILRRGESSRGGKVFDERAAPISFARPAVNMLQSHPIRTTLISPVRPNADTPLPSPSAISDISRTDSMDGPPSLLSDTGSTFSTSPRYPGSPTIELPPLIGTRAESRRPSLPVLHLGTNSFVSDSDHQGPTLDYDRKALSASTTSLPSLLPPASSLGSVRSESASLRHHATAQTWPPAQLPSFETLTRPMGEAATKDDRMNLSSLLR
ncbi:MAG: hypothetical protein M1817_001546 [Caeruleum heppii]|nr:MAG: hypothetical protein M1817_001546 [Caeruleum heppii]